MSVLGLMSVTMPTTALAAYEECVHVVGNESSGEKLALDPARQVSLDDAALQFAICNRLVDLDEKFEVVPELAESWEVADEGRSLTFRLRRDVRFHDGSDFDAEDVVHTFRRILDPALASPAQPIHSFLTAEGIQAIDKHTVQLKTGEPVAELPLLLTNKFTMIVPAGSTPEQLKEKAIGTGPFMVEKVRDR
jgi:peptide/nickel transport system substrate-binding protein